MVTVTNLQSDDPEHTFLTPQELAEELRTVSVGRLSAWRQTGGGPDFVKFGRTVLYKLSDVQKWIADSTRHSTADVRPQRARRSR